MTSVWQFGALSLLLLFVHYGSAEASVTDAKDDRPNIIFIIADDHRYDAFGAFNPALETPALDRMINDGVVFENAFVTTSLCSPSRASILSGQVMRNHGVVDNNSPMPEGFEPFSVHLDRAGYDTAFVGKWHMGASDASPKPGFDHWVSFDGQGNYGPTDAFGQPSVLNVNGDSQPQDGYITDVLTDYAVDWLEDRGDEPFFLYLSHKAVHLPFTPAERHADQYSALPIKRPVSADLQKRSGPTPMWLSAQRNSWAGVDFPYYSTRTMEAFQRDYYGALSAVDDSVARLLGWIDGGGNGRDTVVVYTSDNGFMFGEQGLLDKRAAYEASMRVPMIFFGPAVLGDARHVPTLARNIDIAPTLLSLASIEPPATYDGRDMLAVPSTDKEPLIYEYYWEFNYPQTPSTFAIRTDRYKYVQYHGVWDVEELFDLKEDPDELVNLIQDPAHQQRKVEMRAQLYEALASEEGRPQIPFTSRYNQGAVFWSDSGSSTIEFPQGWRRDAGSADKYEHFLPDGSGKDGRLKAITPAVRRILDSETQSEAP
ncbi:MAG: sulfatase [Pseudomonadota bacterium]